MSRYPLLLMLFLLGLSSVVWGIAPVSFGMGRGALFIGGAILVAGAALILVAAGLFRRRATTLDPTKAPDQLVVDGLYRLSRNPMYLGMLWILIGAALMLNSVLSLLCPVIFFVWMNGVIIPREEQRVEAVFGEAYLRYKQQTRRWI